MDKFSEILREAIHRALNRNPLFFAKDTLKARRRFESFKGEITGEMEWKTKDVPDAMHLCHKATSERMEQ